MAWPVGTRLSGTPILRDPTVPHVGDVANETYDASVAPPMREEREYLKFIQVARWGFYEHFGDDPTYIYLPFSKRVMLMRSAYVMTTGYIPSASINPNSILVLDRMELRGQPEELPTRLVLEIGDSTFEWSTAAGFSETIRIAHPDTPDWRATSMMDRAVALMKARHRMRDMRNGVITPAPEQRTWYRRPRERDDE
jgi:hypothetical protein